MRLPEVGNAGQIGHIGVQVETVDLQPGAEAGTAPVDIGYAAGDTRSIDPQVEPGELDIVRPPRHLGGYRELPQAVGRHPVDGISQPLQQGAQVVGVGVQRHVEHRQAAFRRNGPDQRHVAAAGQQRRQTAKRQDTLVQPRFQPGLPDDIAAIAESVDPKRQPGLHAGRQAEGWRLSAGQSYPTVEIESVEGERQFSLGRSLGRPLGRSLVSLLVRAGLSGRCGQVFDRTGAAGVADLDFDAVQFHGPHRRIDGGAEVVGLLENGGKLGGWRIVGGLQGGRHGGAQVGTFRAEVALDLELGPRDDDAGKAQGAGASGVGLAERYSHRQGATLPDPPGGQFDRQRDAPSKHRPLDLKGSHQTAGNDLGIDRLDTLPDTGGGVAIDDGAVLYRELVELNGFGQPVGRRGGVGRRREVPVAAAIAQDFERYHRLDQRHALDLDTAAQQRHEGDTDVQLAQANHVRLGSVGQIGQPSARYRQGRTGQQRQIDIAFERDGTAGRGADALGYLSLVRVPVDQAGDDEDSADNQQQNGQDSDEKLLHASSADTVRSNRSCPGSFWQRNPHPCPGRTSLTPSPPDRASMRDRLPALS
jgi:hypothetical protein